MSLLIVEDNIRRLVKLNLRIEETDQIPSSVLKSRPWKKRLLSLPWNPWKTMELVPNYKIQITNQGTIRVNKEMKYWIEEILFENPRSEV